MTQQDETAGREHATPPPGLPVPRTGAVEEREPTAPPSVAPMPSAHLPSVDSVPEAYLAPPQPGEPRYGQLPAFGLGAQGYGQPGAGRFGGRGRLAAARARRDPLLAGIWERIAASLLDWIIILGVPVAVFISPLLRISRELQGLRNKYPDLNSPAAHSALNSINRDPTFAHYTLAAFGFALAYFWIMHAIWGATVGKLALGTRVVKAADQSRISIWAAGIRAVASLVGPVIIVFAVGPLQLLGEILWLADSGLPAIAQRAQSLHDKAAGTIVVRKRWLDRQRSDQPNPW